MTFSVTVFNRSDYNLQVNAARVKLPDGTTYQSADSGGRLNAFGEATWDTFDLPAWGSVGPLNVVLDTLRGVLSLASGHPLIEPITWFAGSSLKPTFDVRFELEFPDYEVDLSISTGGQMGMRFQLPSGFCGAKTRRGGCPR